MDKGTVKSHLVELLEKKISELEVMLSSIQESRDSASKSTAGDKHEVGRAMMQSEMDNLQAQIGRHKADLSLLNDLPLELSNETIRKGHLIHTDKGIYYLSIGLGAVDLGADKVFVISVDAPIGKSLLGRSSGDEVTFNGRTIHIRDIS